MIVGQLGFGLFGDALGRRRVYGKELIFTILGTLMVVLLPWKGLSQIGVVAWISIFRCLTGVGVGGGAQLLCLYVWPYCADPDTKIIPCRPLCLQKRHL